MSKILRRRLTFFEKINHAKEIKIGVASSDLQRPRIVQKESITVKQQEKGINRSRKTGCNRR